ncbi:hypothetical protein [Desulfovibrio gilichinskyi]|uniref:hypothetical protein n=1 Tax=Desulfovibrio gilichinskyi TaxID=1519643 RepID=UPI0014830CDC|nr:hypothetical protein [Desulfovibrio gilichinskyi]
MVREKVRKWDEEGKAVPDKEGCPSLGTYDAERIINTKRRWHCAECVFGELPDFMRD